jgi:hypothetical protein
MALSWNEIKDRALLFSKEWADTVNEEADAKPFLVAFFNVFGISNKRVATFEHKVKKLDDKDGYIDLLWKGTILIEMKSRGKNLDKAYQQAKDYTHGLKQHELPKYILVSDFENFRLYDLEDNSEQGIATVEFKLSEFYKNVNHFGQLLGYPKKVYKEQDPANIKAAELMGKLHDRLKEIGYTGHPLEVYLVRVLFCLFAEDTSIFNKQQFQDYIEQRTADDGSDLAAKIQELFQVLNTAKENRFKNLDEQLAEFPYVNGKLFDEMLPTASFDSKMRQALLDCCYMDWSRISPAIFGSMFQSVMNPKERRNLGAHYTSETNILKLIKPLFLDELWKEFESVNHDATQLTKFHTKISNLRFLDPACGCGNFLIITYREIRLLEFKVVLTLQKLNKRIHQMDFLDISLFFKVNVDKFYGIEYEEFPARIAEVAMWLIDHQMNMYCSIETGEKLFRIPLVNSANITNGDALKVDWNELLATENAITINSKDAEIIINSQLKEPELVYGKIKLRVDHFKIVDEFSGVKPDTKFDYILGNPPFIGSRIMNKEQKASLTKVFDNAKNIGELDYVTAWYIKAAKYIQNTKIKVGFVSTNSIVQGLQTSILWGQLLNKYNIKIHFAHRTFKWRNEAKGNAAVYCVIVGFANYDTTDKIIFDYEDIKGEAHEIKARNINPYLVDAKNIFIDKKSSPICKVPEMNFGNMPADGGEFLFTTEEKSEFLKKEPNAKLYFKPFISAHEFLHNKERWCLWLEDIEPSELKKMKYVLERVQNVKAIRATSSRPQLANIPNLFAQITQPKNTDYILIPRHSSENRKIIPIGFFKSKNIAADSCLIIPNANLFHFGVLMSAMHIAWVKSVCGRLKSDFRYSKDIVYNNYPWPYSPNDKQIKAIETASQKVLDVRLELPKSSLADLYDPLTMPPALVKAHSELDKAVDLAYRPQPFTSEANRMVFLFELYEKYTADLFTKEYKKKKSNN